MKRLAPMMVTGAGCLWGCMGILVRGMNAVGLETMEIVAVRCLVTCLCMAAGLFFFDRKAFRIHPRDLWCFAGTGSPASCFLITVILRRYDDLLSVAAVLLYTAPSIVVVLSAVLFGEKMSKRKLAALAVTFIGCVCVTGGIDGGFLTAGGILTGLGAGLGYALYSIFGRYAINRGYSSLTITLWTFGVAFAGCVPLVDMGKVLRHFAGQPGAAFQSLFWIFMTTVLAYILYTLGLQQMETGKASVITSIEPVVASAIGCLWYGEAVTAAGAAGMVMVVGAIVLLNCEKRTGLSGRKAGNEIPLWRLGRPWRRRSFGQGADLFCDADEELVRF